MSVPLVSCIVPVFNGERYLAETLESVLAQSHRRLEVLVVDDGSTDATPAVAARFARRVGYLRRENAGPSAARNHGVRSSRGEFLTFVDADDLWHPEKLARQLARFRARPELDYCVAFARNFWSPDVPEDRTRGADPRLLRPIPAYLPTTLLVRRQSFDRVGPFDEALGHAHSTEWFLRARELGLVGELLRDVLLRRRLHRTNRSSTGAAASVEEYLHLVKGALDRRRRGEEGDAGATARVASRPARLDRSRP